jgi:hypothetical protein
MPVLFSDEKLFTVNGGLNKQNDRIYATSREQANNRNGRYNFYIFTNNFYMKLILFQKEIKRFVKFPLNIMVWVGISENGTTNPYFLEPGKFYIIP